MLEAKLYIDFQFGNRQYGVLPTVGITAYTFDPAMVMYNAYTARQLAILKHKRLLVSVVLH